ncbi:hypothetical protein, partial [Salmonella enterica]|uniref:hypothetical protein n=1 Tax=Salmonella enterica TaxID=28901 RepID=UPI00092FE036
IITSYLLLPPPRRKAIVFFYLLVKQTIILAMVLINNRSRATYIQRVSELPDGIPPVLFPGLLTG